MIALEHTYWTTIIPFFAAGMILLVGMARQRKSQLDRARAEALIASKRNQ